MASEVRGKPESESTKRWKEFFKDDEEQFITHLPSISSNDGRFCICCSSPGV